MFPGVEYTEPSIALSENVRNYEIKEYQYYVLPSFHGHASEDPLPFLHEFYTILQGFPLHGLTLDELKLRLGIAFFESTEKVVDHTSDNIEKVPSLTSEQFDRMEELDNENVVVEGFALILTLRN
ncbi:hypothetical protein LIER_42904 [Lithospermum erythrorhizon]|uniref:Uncharacterized protein n=1 Tax=Lithospermum erythrorhizon TaxID=34254 RepID=A0AAV3P441_LITER